MLGENKLDFVISRMAHGLNHLPNDPLLLFGVLGKYFSLLSEDGCMLIQFPSKHSKLLKIWSNYVHRNFKERIKVKVVTPVISNCDNAYNRAGGECSLLIEKVKDGVEYLPGLPNISIFRATI